MGYLPASGQWVTHSSTSLAYWGVLRVAIGLDAAGEGEIVDLKLNGSSSLCWITIDRARMADRATSLPILILTRSQPRSLLSIARSKSAWSLIRPSRSRKERIDHIWRTFKARLAPTCLPAFQAGLPTATGSYCEIPMTFLLWPSGRRRNDCGKVAHGNCRPRRRRSPVDPTVAVRNNLPESRHGRVCAAMAQRFPAQSLQSE